jgi:hypothetical protein
MNAKTFTRRQLVRGSGGVVMGLPFLEALIPREARGQAAAPPRRFVVWNHPEGGGKQVGTVDTLKEWRPGPGTPRTGFELAPLMAPLGPWKNKLIVTWGIDNTSAGPAPQNHSVSTNHILTGGSGTSIDQTIARKLGAGYRFASLELGVSVRTQGAGDPTKQTAARVIYAGGSPVPCLNDPRAAFSRLFSAGAAPVGTLPTATPQDGARLLAKRQSVVDAVKKQLDALSRQVGSADRQRLEAHLSAVRQLEKELLQPPAPAAPQPPSVAVDCRNPRAPTGGDLPAITRQQVDLMVLALACRLTPVVSLQWSHTGCPETFPWLGASTSDFHLWCHNDARSTQFLEYWRKGTRWLAEQFAYLLGRMAQIDEGGGTLLDSSAVVFVSSYGNAGLHNPANVPFVIAGNAGGALRTGQFLQYPGIPHNRMLLALAKAYGVAMPSYGDPKYGTEPLGDVLA